MTIAELQEKRAKHWQSMKDFLDSHRKDGVLSAEDEATYNKMDDALNSMTREIEREKQAQAYEKMLNKPTSVPVFAPQNIQAEGISFRATDEYHEAFMNHIRHKTQNALQEDTDSEGGYLVPVEFERQLIQKRDKVDPIFSTARKITLGAHEKNVPIVSSYGAAALISEEGSYPDTDDSFGQVTFKAYKFGRIVKASEELIADSAFNIEGHLRDSHARSIGKAEATYFWNGTGSSQPQGVLTGAQTGVTTTANNKITADEIINLYYSLAEQYRAEAAFFFNDSTMKEIRKLKDGNGQYLWQPGLAGTNDAATILSKPVYTSEYIPAISSSAKIGVFANMQEAFWIADREGINFLRLNELYAATGQVGFRCSARSDGHVVIAEAAKTLVMHA